MHQPPPLPRPPHHPLPLLLLQLEPVCKLVFPHLECPLVRSQAAVRTASLLVRSPRTVVVKGGEEGVLHGSDQYHVFRFGGVKGGEGEGGLGWDGHWELVVRLQTTEGGYEGG